MAMLELPEGSLDNKCCMQYFPHQIFQSINMVWWDHLGMSCWSDEDYIGRVARVARKTHGITLPISTIQKSLIHYRNQWRRICANWDARLLSQSFELVVHKEAVAGAVKVNLSGIVDHIMGFYTSYEPTQFRTSRFF